MKKLIVTALGAMFFASSAFAQTLEFTCVTLDQSSTVVVKVGAGEDGFPLESYVVDGVEKVDSVVQYIFQVSQSGLSNIINTVEQTEAGRIHTSAGIGMTQFGLVLESISFNVDAENVEASAVQSVYACSLPAEDAAAAPEAETAAE